MKPKTCEMLATALRQLVVRFVLEEGTTKTECKCLQFEDNEDCRHLYALHALETYDREAKP